MSKRNSFNIRRSVYRCNWLLPTNYVTSNYHWSRLSGTIVWKLKLRLINQLINKKQEKPLKLVLSGTAQGGVCHVVWVVARLATKTTKGGGGGCERGTKVRKRRLAQDPKIITVQEKKHDTFVWNHGSEINDLSKTGQDRRANLEKLGGSAKFGKFPFYLSHGVVYVRHKSENHPLIFHLMFPGSDLVEHYDVAVGFESSTCGEQWRTLLFWWLNHVLRASMTCCKNARVQVWRENAPLG
jgi:hypothetical protein